MIKENSNSRNNRMIKVLKIKSNNKNPIVKNKPIKNQQKLIHSKISAKFSTKKT